ncbi:MAG: hypothetical protein ACRC76_12995 [Proteocatella sp.]
MLERYINFSAEELICDFSRSWNELCEYLEVNELGYDYNYDSFFDICKGKNFFNVFSKTLMEAETELTIDGNSISLLRRFIIEEDEKKLNEDRFIPCSKYLSLNRMNDIDRCYVYIVTDYYGVPIEQVFQTGIMELSATKDNAIWCCDFHIKKDGLKIINLASEYRLPQDTDKYNNLLYSKCRQYLKEWSKNKEKINEIISYYTAQLLIKIMEDSMIFSPVDKKNTKIDEQRKLYKPFHFICDYYQKAGYSGMLFRSTVHKNGVNLVFFNNEDISPKIETLQKVIYEEYI